MVQLQSIENHILNLLQEGIPLEKNPWEILAKKANLPTQQLLSITKKLLHQQIIRQIAPIYDTKMLGYQSCLVAFEVQPNQLQTTANTINQHPGVSHNYQRNHTLNLWFTIATPPDSILGLENTVKILAQKTKPKHFLLLPSKKMYKISVKLKLQPKPNTNLSKENVKRKKLNYRPLKPLEKQIILHTQQNLPLLPRPFQTIAQKLQLNEEQLLQTLQQFQTDGIMRRFAALLNHRKAGFQANGMAVWNAPAENIDEIGYKIASYQAVSHCYQRPAYPPLWPYNLYSMIHATTKEEVENIAKTISQEISLPHYSILYSTKEFKKQRLQYFTPDYYQWEKKHIL